MQKLDKCLHPLLAKREQKLFTNKLQKQMKENGVEYMVLTQAHSINYAIGYYPVIPIGPMVVVPAEGDITLIISTLESADAYASTQDVEVREFLSWVFIDDGSEESRKEKGDDIDPNESTRILFDIVDKSKLQGKIAIEMGSISKNMWDKLKEELDPSYYSDASKIMDKVRIIKSPWEIEILELAAKHLDKTWRDMIDHIKPGIPAWKLDALFLYYAGKNNLDVGTAGRNHMFIPAAGPYYGLCGVPRGYDLQKGDVIKFDVGFTHFGYHSDIARTFAVGGDTSDEVQEVYKVLYEANRLGVSMLKPGVKCSEIYHAVRNKVEESTILSKYPRGHVGHSVGCGWGPEEYPQLSARVDLVIEENMVFCLETPYSATGDAPVIGGFNLEDTHVITENGHRSFTEMPNNIFWK